MNGTNSNNINLGRNLFIAALGTAILAPVAYEEYIGSLPSTNEKYSHISNDLWEIEGFSIIDTDQIKFNSLKNFSENLLKNAQNIDAESLEVVNNKFWDLI